VYDTSFDDSGSRRTDRTVLWALRIAGLIATIAAVSADAQMPGAPVLQNAWSTPGIVGALNVTGGSDGPTYAAAGSWAPVSGRFQLSGGVGYQTRTGSGSSAAYGARLAMPFGGASSSFGFAAFAGIGGGGSRTKKTTPSVPVDTLADSTASTAQIPVGVGLGWRRSFGGARGLSLYATPSYVFYTGGSHSGSLFRTAVAADFGITQRIGATAGIEFGATRSRAIGGPSGTLYGIGVSYALGRR
jgi:hypothetical protein